MPTLKEILPEYESGPGFSMSDDVRRERSCDNNAVFNTKSVNVFGKKKVSDSDLEDTGFPRFLRGVTFLKNLKSANTKTIKSAKI